MLWKAILLLVAAMVAQGTKGKELYHMSDEFIAEINAVATTWTAGRNFPKDTTQEFLNRLGCAWVDTAANLDIKPYDGNISFDLLDNFDARTKWSHCASLQEITNQGSCGDCWAVSTASVVSDRLCIQKGVDFHASTEDIVSCCHSCGSGCRGGSHAQAFAFYCREGVVSGAANTKTGCKPYSHQISTGNTPLCVRKCTNGNYKTTYEKDLQRGSKAYSLRGEEQLKQDLYENGPIAVTFTVYEDFYHYQGGIYQHQFGKYAGRHAVKLIGWGVENNTPYWLIANSWGTDWGNHGFVKFLRGSNNCGIEWDAATAMA